MELFFDIDVLLISSLALPPPATSGDPIPRPLFVLSKGLKIAGAGRSLSLPVRTVISNVSTADRIGRFPGTIPRWPTFSVGQR